MAKMTKERLQAALENNTFLKTGRICNADVDSFDERIDNLEKRYNISEFNQARAAIEDDFDRNLETAVAVLKSATIIDVEFDDLCGFILYLQKDDTFYQWVNGVLSIVIDDDDCKDFAD